MAFATTGLIPMPAIGENNTSTDNRDQIFSIWRPGQDSEWVDDITQRPVACSEAELGYKMILGKNRYGRSSTSYLFCDNRGAVEKVLDRLLYKMANLLSFVTPRKAADLNDALSRRAGRNIRIQAEEKI